MDNSHTRFSVSWRQAQKLKEPFASLKASKTF
jgi:hypothetical protein